MQRSNKYRNRKILISNLGKFDSEWEHERYKQLLVMERVGAINDLTRQPKFVLQDKFRDKNGVAHKAITYTADFMYVRDGVTIVEDAKSSATEKDIAFVIRKKLFIFKFPEYEFRIVKKS